MEWNIKTISRRCSVCGEPFHDGEEVVSLVFKADSGETLRCDVASKCLQSFTFPGKLIGQWRRVFSSGTTEEDRTKQETAIREEFFFSLFDGEESVETDILKQLLALYLERNRILRRVGKTESFIKFIRVHDKKEYLVPDKEILPEDLTSVENIFEMLR